MKACLECEVLITLPVCLNVAGYPSRCEQIISYFSFLFVLFLCLKAGMQFIVWRKGNCCCLIPHNEKLLLNKAVAGAFLHWLKVSGGYIGSISNAAQDFTMYCVLLSGSNCDRLHVIACHVQWLKGTVFAILSHLWKPRHLCSHRCSWLSYLTDLSIALVEPLRLF